MSNLDLDLVRHALSVARKNGFAEVELSVGEDSFSAKLEPKRAAKSKAPKASAQPAPEPEQDATVAVRSSLVGYFRQGKVPVEIGVRVNKGDIVAVIAALGIANDIEAPESGEVLEVLVEQNQPVEYGQVLMTIKP